MLRKSFYTLLLSFMMSATAMADMKIGFVNVARLLEKAPQAEQAKKELEREFSGRDKKLVAEQKEIKSMEDRAGKDSATMGADERQRLERDLVNRKREAKRAQDEFREDFNVRRNEELSKLQKEIFEAIQSLAKQGNYDLLLTDGVVYAADGIDVTDQVEKRLESSYRPGSKK